MGSKWFTGGVVAAPRGRIQFDFILNGVRYRPSIRRPPYPSPWLKLSGLNIKIHAAGRLTFEVDKMPSTRELLARLREFRGRLPRDFKFDRLEANDRC